SCRQSRIGLYAGHARSPKKAPPGPKSVGKARRGCCDRTGTGYTTGPRVSYKSLRTGRGIKGWQSPRGKALRQRTVENRRRRRPRAVENRRRRRPRPLDQTTPLRRLRRIPLSDTSTRSLVVASKRLATNWDAMLSVASSLFVLHLTTSSGK